MTLAKRSRTNTTAPSTPGVTENPHDDQFNDPDASGETDYGEMDFDQSRGGDKIPAEAEDDEVPLAEEAIKLDEQQLKDLEKLILQCRGMPYPILHAS